MNRNWIFAGLLCLSLLAVAAFVFRAGDEPSNIALLGQDYCQQFGEPEQVWIEGGDIVLGEFGLYEDEGPPRRANVKGFWIDRHEVTNAQFAKFVDATGYVTIAERDPDPADYPGVPEELLVPGSALFVPPTDLSRGGDPLQWWQFVPGANWRAPEGPGSSVDGREAYPVIHIAYEDTLAYADWKGHGLPTEAEWEFAARSGSPAKYPWGETLTLEGEQMANTWQGSFPLWDAVEDGHKGISPVGCFPANGLGLYDMIGNVWEWTNTPYFPSRREQTDPGATGYDPRQPGLPVRVIKGGSFLCAPNYCMRYRPAARHAQDTGLGTGHIGFRTVKRVEASPGVTRNSDP